MFPSNLHKNIVQLDRQISLLEKECENMEAETRKKSIKSEPMHCKSSRISNLQIKSPNVKICSKKNNGLNKKKAIPPCSARIQSSSSVQSQCSKSWNDSSGTFTGKKTKSFGGDNYLQGCTCQTVKNNQHNLKKDYGTRNSGCQEKHIPDFDEGKDMYVNTRDHVLHKEVLIPNPGSTIEVTVTRKSKSKEDSSVAKAVNAASSIEKKAESCKCQTKGPKWSEILYLESAKNRGMNNINSAESQTLTGLRDLISPSLKLDSGDPEQNFFHNNNKKDESILKETLEAPVKLSPVLLRNRNIIDINSMDVAEIQCYSENNNCEKKKKFSSDLETYDKKKPLHSPFTDLPEKSKRNSSRDSSSLKNDFFLKLQQNCENLIKEKEKLAEELSVKENTLKTMKKREEEYTSLITSLKSSLVKLQEQAQEDSKTLKELNTVAVKLAEQKKISEAIQKKHISLQDMFERCSLENHKLQTQIKLLKLESQKHDVLLAGRDAEINRYRDEIKNFQRQLSDHIEFLKSSSQGLDAEKVMLSIIQQSQLFFQSDFKSVFAVGNQKDSSKPNALMHSSPTSTKSSVLNSSWNQISSIHERDQSKDESDFVINLKEDSNEKEFFQIFGDASSSDSKSPKYPETLIDKISDKKDLKNSSSFTSCVSLREGSDSSGSKSGVSEKDEFTPERDMNKAALQKVQSNIDELLKNLKLKLSKEIFESSDVDSTIKDFLNDSQISSITQEW